MVSWFCITGPWSCSCESSQMKHEMAMNGDHDGVVFGETHTSSISSTLRFGRYQEVQVPTQLAKWQIVYHGPLVTLSLTHKYPRRLWTKCTKRRWARPRLNVLFEESFDKAFESHFNGVYCTRRLLTQNFNLVSISPRGNHKCEAKVPLPHLRVVGQDKKNLQKRRQSPLKRSK